MGMVKLLYKEETVTIPSQCDVSLNNKIFTFSGPLGTQTLDVSKYKFTFSLVTGEESTVVLIQSWHGNRKKNNLLYTVGSHIRNNANGVVKGYKYVIKALYNWFSIQLVAQDQGKKIIVKNFMGNKIPKEFTVMGEAKASIGENKDFLEISGINLEDVSQTAANVINACRKQKKYDPRVFLDGLFVVNKVSI